jgi:hypothetical protein
VVRLMKGSPPFCRLNKRTVLAVVTIKTPTTTSGATARLRLGKNYAWLVCVLEQRGEAPRPGPATLTAADRPNVMDLILSYLRGADTTTSRPQTAYGPKQSDPCVRRLPRHRPDAQSAEVENAADANTI